MKRLLVPAFCCLLLLAALVPKANAQAANARGPCGRSQGCRLRARAGFN